MKNIYFLIIIILVLSSFSACNREKHVKFEVTGTAQEIRIYWKCPLEGGNYYVSKFWFDETLPWIRTYKGKKGDFVCLRATNVDSNIPNGIVNVTIYVDGALFKTSSCQGTNNQAQVSGTIE
ncbi:MAG: hypothetical protein APR63_14570 [Desulfuromonas sp. SDB]|nr:MAG: hypothetical protein APR63_14570 [Desulfuromonas sp. SDB]